MPFLSACEKSCPWIGKMKIVVHSCTWLFLYSLAITWKALSEPMKNDLENKVSAKQLRYSHCFLGNSIFCFSMQKLDELALEAFANFNEWCVKQNPKPNEKVARK